MINVSDEFEKLMHERTNFKENAEVTFTDGTVLELAAEDFTVSNNMVSDAADANGVPLGVAISRSIQMELMNDDDHLQDYDFFGAKVRLYLTFQLSATTEKIEYGIFTVTSPETYGSTVIISANDDMYKADKAYSTNLIFPASIRDMLIDSCDICDIPLLSTSFPNDDFIVLQKPSSDYTHRQIVGYIAMLAGGNARVNRQGSLEILSYSPDFVVAEPHQLTEWKNLKVDTDDITITGVQTTYEKDVVVTDSDGNTTTEQQAVTVLVGEKGYVLSISNPLIAGAEQTAVSQIGESLIGMNFRKFEGDHIAYPIAEFMDPVEVTDRKGNVYRSFLTDINFVFFGFTTMKNSAESGVRNSSKYSSNPTAALIEAKKLIRAERTARETAIERLEKTLGDGSGLYMSTGEMEDGSFIYYAHNKPTIEESDIIWLMTAEAIGISTDGGKTYPYGFVVDGELITRILQTEGVNADWINAGTLVVKDAQGNVIFSVNMDSREVLMDADHIMIGGGKTLSQMVEESKSLHVILSNEYQGIPADSSGNITTFPTCATTVQVLYGQSDITGKCTLSATASTGVTGSLSGTTYTVTALAADTGYVDIKATYLTMTATKRFTISKVKSGSNVKMLNTDLSLTQEMLTERGAVGHSRNWTVMTATTGLNAGDSVIIQVYNSSKDNSEAFIMATVNEVLSTNRINATSAGLLDKGDSGRVYSLEPSATVIKRGQDSIPVPDAITFSAFYRDGNSASRTAYAGRFVVETSTDGNTWSQVYTSAADETSCKYELYTALEDGSGNYIEDGNGNTLVAWYDESSVMMRATLYAAGGTTSSLDMQTVPVVIDVAALTHLQIFNLLTNNGAWQGLFYENGHLYLNGEYMKFIGANIGGWDIGEKAIYKDVADPSNPNIVYRYLLQPPSFALNDPEMTWILSCQISTDGGKTFFAKYKLLAEGALQMLSDNQKYMTSMSPADESNLDGCTVLALWEPNEAGTALVAKTFLRPNGRFNLRQLIIADPIAFPHIVGDGQYLQLSPVNGELWGVVVEALNGYQWLRPASSGTVLLGSEEYKWGQIWSNNSAISTSDRNEKNSIAALDEDKWLNFLMGLQIVSYKLNDGTSGRLHHGMIAQDVEVLLNTLGIDSKDFAGFIRWQKTRREERFREVVDDLGQKRQQRYFEEIPIYDEEGNPVYGYGLRYEEFLPMTIKAVQGIYMENLAIRTELADLKQKVANLTN